MSDAVVLVPGLQSDASSWLPFVRHLSMSRAVCLPYGHQFAQCIARMSDLVLAQSPARFHLAGWSMGGYVALDIMRRAPERLSSLALISTTAAPEEPSAATKRQETLTRAHRSGLASYQRANLAQCLFDPSATPVEMTESLVATAKRLGFGALQAQTTAIVARPDSRPDLERSRVPLFVLAGADDAIISVAHAREMHVLRPDAQYHELPNCGHCPPIEAPDTVASLYDQWLDDVARQCRSDVAQPFGTRP